MIRIILSLTAALLTLNTSAAAATSTSAWRIGPREAWIQDVPRTSAVAQTPPPMGLLLHDRQIRVTAAGDDRYEHTIQRAVTAQTGEHATQVYIAVDPRFQELVIHSLRRGHPGEPGTVFTAAQIREQVSSQSTEADPRQREGNPVVLISIRVPSLQAGDILECEYTVHSTASRAPGMLVGHYAAQWPSGADVPVQWERLRVTWPPERRMQFRISGGLPGDAPKVETHAGELDIQWHALMPIVSDTDTPRWFRVQSTVELSDFTDWAQVAALLAPQYGSADATLDAQPRQWIAGGASAIILNALHLLQSKVHTTRIAGGGPYAPADPAVVLQRGYGESRDLARLLASLLRRLGIDAHVALADRRHGALLDTTLPSPFILDVALVRARLGTTDYWLNPGAPIPAATLNADLPDLRHALIISTTAGGVVALPAPELDSRVHSVTQQFDLRGGNTRPATLTVTTQFRGSWAQAVRTDLRAQTPAQLQLTQIQSVAQDYPAATADGNVQLQDTPDSPTLQLVARFAIPRPFGDPEDPHVNFFAEALADAAQPRDESTRQFPLGLPWPLQLEEHIVAPLPPHYTAPVGRIVIQSPAFRYQRDVLLTQGTLHIDHSYVTLSDHVDPADYPKFLEANAQVYEALGLRAQPEARWWTHALNWLASHLWATLATVAVVALAAAAGRRLRREQSSAPGVGQ